MKGNRESKRSEEMRKRLESLSREELEEAVRSFWRWFEQVKHWEESRSAKGHRPSGN